MKIDVLLGLQWGDEGKGKIVDVLAPKYKVVARFQGGPNAGHTLEFDGFKHVLHQIPSGIFRPNISNVIGNGVVLDPVVFKKEVEGLAKYKLPIHETLIISKKASLIIPTHRLLDAAMEQAKGEARIGSTLRGIGPAYMDKVARQGLRVGDVLLPNFKKKYERLVAAHRTVLDFHKADYQKTLDELESEFFKAIEYLKTFPLENTEYYINNALNADKPVLAEGAQGSLLDLDFGSYPFVTSSTTMSPGACTGLGVAPRQIGQVYGVFKAYCTRVGGGPFPTELLDETGEKIRQDGREFGATTGRSRRTGWLDLPSLKYTIMINGVSQLVMMKVDVLNDFEVIRVCTHYELEDGSITDELPYDLCEARIKPVYKDFDGWKCSLSGIRSMDEIPPKLKEYVQFLEDQLGLAIHFISTGPDRESLIRRDEPQLVT